MYFSEEARERDNGNKSTLLTELIAQFTSLDERVLNILISHILSESHDFTLYIIRTTKT